MWRPVGLSDDLIMFWLIVEIEVYGRIYCVLDHGKQLLRVLITVASSTAGSSALLSCLRKPLL